MFFQNRSSRFLNFDHCRLQRNNAYNKRDFLGKDAPEETLDILDETEQNDASQVDEQMEKSTIDDIAET